MDNLVEFQLTFQSTLIEVERENSSACRKNTTQRTDFLGCSLALFVPLSKLISEFSSK